jgi:hypothetical protein
MKHLKSMILGILMAMTSVPALAQSDFFLNLYGRSNNLWSNTFLQFPTNLINAYLTLIVDEDAEYAVGGAYRYDIFKIKNEAGNADLDNGSYWGFKGKDLFNNVQYGIKFGWQPELSPFGIYVSCGYEFNRFSARWDANDWNKYKIHSVRPGVGIRITPFISMLEEYDWSPILEVGTSYNYNFSCRAPYDNNKEQFNNGMISTFALGVRLYENYSITAGAELNHYSLFNKDFTVDGITYPYKNIKTSKTTIFVSVSHDF